MPISLLPDNPGAWTYHRYEDLYAIPREVREKLQLEAVRINFARMRDRIPALKKLAGSKTGAQKSAPARDSGRLGKLEARHSAEFAHVSCRS